MLNIASDTRPGYNENQDTLVVLRHPKNPQMLLVAIADGQGGQPGGKQASQQACETIVQAAAKCRPMSLRWTGKWKRLLAKTDRALRDNAEAGFTTLIAFAIIKRKLYGISNGDSALMSVTAKDVLVLTKEQMKNPPVGSGCAAPFVFKYSLPPPWTILAMTDGVWKFAGWDKIWDSALGSSKPETKIESIRKAASTLGRLQDDFTLLVIQEDGKPKKD